MEEFLEKEVQINSEHYLWVEKYRPMSLDDYVGNSDTVGKIKSFIKEGQIPHLLFYGPQGTGKTTISKIISNSIDADTLYINASHENRVDDVRDKITNFVMAAGFRPLKLVLLDEADRLTPDAQGTLRNTLETYSLKNRFILTCNYHEKLIPPLWSRFQSFEIKPLSMKDIAIRLKSILEKENVQHTIEDIGFIVKSYYPDIRKMINFAQQWTVDGVLTIGKNDSGLSDIKTGLISLLKKRSNFTEIRQFLEDGGLNSTDELYKLLFEKIDDFAKGKESQVVLSLAEWSCKSAYNPNKDIVFLACVSEILKIVGK